jgi:hypothetical protein
MSRFPFVSRNWTRADTEICFIAMGAVAALIVAMPILWPFLVKGLAWVVWLLRQLGSLPDPPS